MQLNNHFFFSAANYVKNVSIVCTDIPDIAKLCEPVEEKQILLSYDGRSNVTFIIQKRYGVGKTLVMSYLHQNEFNFYTTSGFKIDESISKLSENFMENLGSSNDSYYDWSVLNETIWQSEQNSTIKITTKPGCSTEVYEIVGRCSFMDVRSTECLRVDICDGVANETVVAIPDSVVMLNYKKPILRKKEVRKTKHFKNNAIRTVKKPKSLFNKVLTFFKSLDLFRNRYNYIFS